jgi:hypothetical protein
MHSKSKIHITVLIVHDDNHQLFSFCILNSRQHNDNEKKNSSSSYTGKVKSFSISSITSQVLQ